MLLPSKWGLLACLVNAVLLRLTAASSILEVGEVYETRLIRFD